MKNDELDKRILHILEQGDLRRKEALEYLNAEGRAVTPDQYRRSVERLIKRGLVEKKRYGVIGLTGAGANEVNRINGLLASSIRDNRIWPILEKLPLRLQAFVILYLCGIVARYHLRPHFQEGFCNFFLWSRGGAGKSKSIKLVFSILGLDPERHSRLAPTASPGELGLRRKSSKGGTGYTVIRSPYLDYAAVSFEELDKCKVEIRKALLFYFQGTRKFHVEGQTLEQKVCVAATANKSPEEIGISDGILRRTVIMNADAVKDELKNVDVIFREIFSHPIPRIDLAAIVPSTKKLTEKQYMYMRTLLEQCVDEKGWQHMIDTETTEILSISMQAVFNTGTVEQAILLTLYYRLMLLETTGMTASGWRDLLTIEWTRSGAADRDVEIADTPKSALLRLPRPGSGEHDMETRIDTELDMIKRFDPDYKETVSVVQDGIALLEDWKSESWMKCLDPDEVEKFKVLAAVFKVLENELDKLQRGDEAGLAILKKKISEQAILIKQVCELQSKALVEAGVQDLVKKASSASDITALEQADTEARRHQFDTAEQKTRVYQAMQKRAEHLYKLIFDSIIQAESVNDLDELRSSDAIDSNLFQTHQREKLKNILVRQKKFLSTLGKGKKTIDLKTIDFQKLGQEIKSSDEWKSYVPVTEMSSDKNKVQTESYERGTVLYQQENQSLPVRVSSPEQVQPVEFAITHEIKVLERFLFQWGSSGLEVRLYVRNLEQVPLAGVKVVLEHFISQDSSSCTEACGWFPEPLRPQHNGEIVILDKQAKQSDEDLGIREVYGIYRV